MSGGVAVTLDGRVYRVRPDMRLVCEVEEELGGIAGLADRFSGGQWRVTELVALVQMLLQAAGKTVDYNALGDGMLRAGLKGYVGSALQFLRAVTAEEGDGA